MDEQLNSNNIITTEEITNNNVILTSDKENQEIMIYSDEYPDLSDKIKKQIKSQDDFLIVMVNPRSGSQQGNIVLSRADAYAEKTVKNYRLVSFPVKKEKKQFDKIREKIEGSFHLSKFEKDRQFTSLIFNIIDKNEYNKGIEFIRRYLSDFPEKNIKILVAGGDGTVLSIVEDINNKGIELKRCIFGAMPFGTGNDLSNALGFGNECQVRGIKSFQRVLYTYLTGNKTKIDIWEINILVDKEKGLIFDVVKDGEKLKVNNKKEKITGFSKTFVNYCSIGFDARVGFQFEQRRSSSRACNKIIYFLEAAKRILCCKKNYGLTQLLESFDEAGDDNCQSLINDSTENELTCFDSKASQILPDDENKNYIQRKTIFKTEKGKIKTDKVLKGNPVNIICQNIDFYMGGTQNIWKKSDHLAIKVEDVNKNTYKKYRKEVLNKFNEQKFDDKKLEFFTYEHGIELGLERVARGLAKKVYQGGGPVFLEFKKYPNATERKALQKVYINVDGEFYHLMNPLQVKIGLNTKICDGQINILKNDSD